MVLHFRDPQENKEMRTDGNKNSNIGDTVSLKLNILFEIHKVLIQLISRPTLSSVQLSGGS
jgi:hypothetical protein